MLLLHVIRLARRAPRDVSTRWDRYWADIRDTGDHGDVLWDASTSDEAQRYLDLLAEYADPTLPVVDVGCGNGRFTRRIATRFDHTVGVDLSPHAVARAVRETPPGPRRVEYRNADMTEPGAGARLAAELGACTVFVRGVLHVMPAPQRRALAANLRDLVGARGTLLLAETNHPGPLLGYLENLGAGPRGLPPPLARAIAAGLPRPRPCGDAEIDDAFPPTDWVRVFTDADARIATVLQPGGGTGTIAGHVAVLRPHGDGPR
ncbi:MULTISPECIES: class I SAM-dependent methyltransferase [unclassified Pseudonocardia]|uniref:class I SAM-dependent methyltransferase n=1 Tax=unclassified Pseudonocardia TaxID=2619320 RepID=UPI001AC28512|nr:MULTISPECIES: class I SAM-dependent methyltransferase [unclassified Pseudonocardia]MBN9099907.1 methyltransferase domain-containing protein [Pseudonocardia sp.]